MFSAAGAKPLRCRCANCCAQRFLLRCRLGTGLGRPITPDSACIPDANPPGAALLVDGGHRFQRLDGGVGGSLQTWSNGGGGGVAGGRRVRREVIGSAVQEEEREASRK